MTKNPFRPSEYRTANRRMSNRETKVAAYFNLNLEEMFREAVGTTNLHVVERRGSRGSSSDMATLDVFGARPSWVPAWITFGKERQLSVLFNRERTKDLSLIPLYLILGLSTNLSYCHIGSCFRAWGWIEARHQWPATHGRNVMLTFDNFYVTEERIEFTYSLPAMPEARKTVGDWASTPTKRTKPGSHERIVVGDRVLEL